MPIDIIEKFSDSLRQELDRILNSTKDYTSFRNALILKWYINSDISLVSLCNLCESDIYGGFAQDREVFRIKNDNSLGFSCGHKKIHCPPFKEIYKNLLSFFLLREKSNFIFYSDNSLEKKVLPKDIEFYISMLFEKLDIPKKNNEKILTSFNKFKVRKTPHRISDPKKKKAFIKALKTHMPTVLKTERYLCAACKKPSFLEVRNNQDFIIQIRRMNKLCKDCKNKKIEEQYKKPKKKPTPKVQNKPKKKTMKGYTLSEEEKKAREKTAFYNNLKKATREVNISNIRIFGQGRTEFIKSTADTKRQKTKGAVSHIEDIDKVVKSPHILFEEELYKEINSFIHSEKGNTFGLTLSNKEELFMLSVQHHIGDRTLSAEECIEKIIAEEF